MGVLFQVPKALRLGLVLKVLSRGSAAAGQCKDASGYHLFFSGASVIFGVALDGRMVPRAGRTVQANPWAEAQPSLV